MKRLRLGLLVGGLLFWILKGSASGEDLEVLKSIRSSENPVLISEESWENKGVGDPSIVWDGKLYKMWYTGYPYEEEEHFIETRIGYAESKDGVNWLKKGIVLDLGKEGEFDVKGVYGSSVLYDEGNKIYKMWYTGVDGQRITGIGYAESQDGIKWEKKGKVLECKSEGCRVSNPSVIKDGNIYRMWYQTKEGNNLYCVYLSTSDDGVNWFKKSKVFEPGRGNEWDDFCVYEPEIRKIDGIYFLFYMGHGSNISPSHGRIGLAISKDGIKWERIGVILDADKEKSAGMCFSPCVVWEKGLRLYYGGKREIFSISLAVIENKEIESLLSIAKPE